MVRHIVLWKLHPEGREEHFLEMKRRLEDLAGKIEGLRSIQVSRCFAGDWDVCLCSEHDSPEALAIYQNDSKHCAVKNYIHAVVSGRSFTDMEIKED